jgi:hypothetical protein
VSGRKTEEFFFTLLLELGTAMQRRDFIGTFADGTIAASLPTRLLAASISDFFSDSISPRRQPRYRNVRCSIT